jgi:hypothetical protein
MILACDKLPATRLPGSLEVHFRGLERCSALETLRLSVSPNSEIMCAILLATALGQ